MLGIPISRFYKLFLLRKSSNEMDLPMADVPAMFDLREASCCFFLWWFWWKNRGGVMHFDVYKPQHMVTCEDCRKKRRRSLINRKSTLKQHHTACGYAKGLPTSSNMKPASVTIHCNHDVTIARMTRKNHTVTKLFPLQKGRDHHSDDSKSKHIHTHQP